MKWIPFADNANQAMVAFRSSPAFDPGATLEVLTIEVAQETWQGWEDSGMLVVNPGPRRYGRMHTNSVNQRLFGRVPMDRPDPVFSLTGHECVWSVHRAR